MTDISVNQIPNRGPQNTASATQSQPRRIATNNLTPDEYWRRRKRKNNGLIEKLYNSIKNLTGLGTGSKRAQKAVEDYKNRRISNKEFLDTMNKYSASQENSAQLLGDGASILAAGFTFFGLNKFFKYANGFLSTNKEVADIISKEIKNTKKELAKKTTKKSNIWEKIALTSGKMALNFTEGSLKTLSSNKKATVAAVILSAIVGGYTKKDILQLNRIGSDEFNVDKKIYGTRKSRNKAEKKLAKKEKSRLKTEKRNENFRNFVSGTINGLMMPVMFLGGIIGAPLYLIGNSLNRYFVANRTDKNKSLEGYVDNLTNDGITTGLLTAGAAIPFIKTGNYTKIFNQNMEKVVKQLSKAKLKNNEFGDASAYKKLETELLNSNAIRNIIGNESLSIEARAQKLIDENIFAAKFKQISNDGSELFKVLKENCPETRTLSQAQSLIDKNLGKGYKLTKLLGVGTVAETYFAKSPDGKEVCIKILKEGISKEKILADKDKFVKIVKGMKDKSQDEIDYLLRNVDDLADGILKEVDLKNEMEAAKRLTPVTHIANVVRPIKVENNVYVMERAKGVSLESFMKLNALYIKKEAAEKLGGEKAKQALKEIEKEMERVQSRMPGFDDIKLKKGDYDYLLTEYQKVFIEQFHKVDKNGKIMHGDMHPGNIFIDPKVLKTRKGKLFTLIDTGNTIEMSKEQSMRALNFTKYVHDGNITDIADFVLEGAKIPSNMSKKEAREKIIEALKQCFFDKETRIGMLNDEIVLTLTDNIMQKYNIIPSSTQLNLNKSRTSARNSLEALQDSLDALNAIDVLAEIKDGNKTKAAIKGGTKIGERIAKSKKYEAMIKAQEKLNLAQLSKAEQLKHKNNPNTPKTNSEDYITYKLKQLIIGTDK